MSRLVSAARPARRSTCHTVRRHRSTLPLTVAALVSAAVLGTTAAADAGASSTLPSPTPSAGPAAARASVLSDNPTWAVPAADRGPVDAAARLTARVGLAGRDPAGLEAFATAVSTPGNPLYGHFLDPAQVRARYGPTSRQLWAVRQWLTAAGLTITDQNSHWVDVAGSPEAMHRAFGTRIDAFSVTESATESVAQSASGSATGSATGGGQTRHAPVGTVSVPGDVATAVSSVAGLAQVTRGAHEGATGATMGGERVTAGRDGSNGLAAKTPPPCSSQWGAVAATGFPAGYAQSAPYDLCGYVPSQLRSAYGVTASGLTGLGFTVAVVDAYGSTTMLADANRYAAAHGDPLFAPGQYVEQVTPKAWTHLTDGPCQSPADWAGEQALDVELVHGIAPDATVRYVGANSCTDLDLTAALAEIVDEHSADVVSASFGETMHQTTGDIDPAIVKQENAVFIAGAAEGIGFDVATGDCGNDAAGLRGPNCDPLSARAQAEWPASSVWATAVGGTALATTPDGRYQWETNMGDKRSVLTPDGRNWDPLPGYFYFGGGGGTSEDFAQPPYQRGIAPNALAHTLGTGAHTPTAMRTLPDVAMNGDLLTSVFVGQTDQHTKVYGESQVGGTSVSAPEFAALQAVAMQGARARFGFANPVLYSRAGEFNDVVDHPAGAPQDLSTVLDLGLNPDGTRKVRLYQLGQDNGLSAAPGYDLATGLGSPSFRFIDGFR
jgi:subtilase family serine protease